MSPANLTWPLPIKGEDPTRLSVALDAACGRIPEAKAALRDDLFTALHLQFHDVQSLTWPDIFAAAARLLDTSLDRLRSCRGACYLLAPTDSNPGGIMKQESTAHHKALGAHIAQLRMARGMTHGELPRAIGVSQQAVFAYEIGERRVSVFVLIKLSRVFKTTVEELMEVTRLCAFRSVGCHHARCAMRTIAGGYLRHSRDSWSGSSTCWRSRMQRDLCRKCPPATAGSNSLICPAQS